MVKPTAKSVSLVHPYESSPRDSVRLSQDIEKQPHPARTQLDTADEEKAPRDPNVVDWEGPDDPSNPMNWSSSKKIASIGLVSLITMLS